MLVEFEWERADQDGYAFRATSAWPRGHAPVDPMAAGPDAAYRSSVTIDWSPRDPPGPSAPPDRARES